MRAQRAMPYGNIGRRIALMRIDDGTEHDLRFGDVGTIVTTGRFVERTTLPSRNEKRRGGLDRGVLGEFGVH